MPATVLNRQWDSLLTTTLDYYQPTLVDNIHKSIPLLWWFDMRGRGEGTRYVDGGAMITVPVIYAKNSNAQSYSKYDRLNLNPTEELTETLENWSELATTVAISRREMRQNSGKHQRAPLLRSKVDVAEMSLKELVEDQMVRGTIDATGTNPTERFAAGNGGKDLIPLGHFIQKDPTEARLVHTVDQNANSWWRNQSFLSTADTYAEFKDEMNNLYNTCSRGSTNDAPDMILSNQPYFEKYEGALMTQQRYGNYADDGAASAGFESLKFKGAVMMWSEFVPSHGDTASDTVVASPTATQQAQQAVAYFINSKWLEFVVDQESHFVTTPFEEPVDQTAVYSKILLMGQLICTQRRKQGLHYAVDTSLIVS